MAKLTLTDLGTTLSNTAANTINNNGDLIESALENTLSRDGTSPNQMNADFDMNTHDILNAGRVDVASLSIDGEPVQSVDIATALKISNNLSDVASVSASRNNLGLTDTATSPSSSFGKDLLDDVDAAAGRTTLGLGTAAVNNIGTSGANVPLLSTSNTWSALQTFGQITVGNGIVSGSAVSPTVDFGSGIGIYRTASTIRVTYSSTIIGDFGATGLTLGANLAVFFSGTGAATTRTNLGLGTAALANTGTSGTTVPLLDGTNTWSGTQTYGTIVLGGGAVAGGASTPTLSFGGSIGLYRTASTLRITYATAPIADFGATGLAMVSNMAISFAGTGAATTRTNLGLGTAAVLNALVGTATYDPPSLADGAGASTTVTVTGAALGDVALASFSLSTQGITVTANVTAANTVTVRFQNETTGVIDLASGTLKAVVLQ